MWGGGGELIQKSGYFHMNCCAMHCLQEQVFFFSPKGKYRSKKINTLNPNSEVSSFWIKTLNVHKKYFVQLLLVSCIGSRKKNKNIVHPEEMVKVFFFYYLQRVSLAERSLHVPFPFYWMKSVMTSHWGAVHLKKYYLPFRTKIGCNILRGSRQE